MNSQPRRARPAGLAAAMAAALASFGAWCSFAAFHQPAASILAPEPPKVGERAREAALHVHLAHLRATAIDQPGDRRAFAEACDAFQNYLVAQAPALPSSHERQAAADLADAFNAYREETRPAPDLAPKPLAPPDTSRADALLQRVATLANDLANASRSNLAATAATRQRAAASDANRLRTTAAAAAMVAFAAAAAAALHAWRVATHPDALPLSSLPAARQLGALGSLAAGVAHEIRNPLAAVKTRLFSLDRELDPHSKAARQTRFIRDEIDRLERIVDQFLRFARPPEPNPEPHPAAPILHSTAELLEPTLAKDAIRIRVDPDARGDALCDPDQIKQLLINLVRNAAEAIGRDGTITLRAARAARNGKPVVEIAVDDDGPGVPPDVRPRLFEPFFSTRASGTGLGLAIAARIAADHRGSLRHQPREPRGATFVLELPAAPQPTPHP